MIDTNLIPQHWESKFTCFKGHLDYWICLSYICLIHSIENLNVYFLCVLVLWWLNLYLCLCLSFLDKYWDMLPNLFSLFLYVLSYMSSSGFSEWSVNVLLIWCFIIITFPAMTITKVEKIPSFQWYFCHFLVAWPHLSLHHLIHSEHQLFPACLLLLTSVYVSCTSKMVNIQNHHP